MGRYRERNLDNVIAELKYVTGVLGMRYITFNDLNLGANPKRLKRLAARIVQSNIQFEWVANISVDEQLDESFFSLLAKAGTTQIQFGIESASPKILKLMGKGFSPETAMRNLEDAHRAGLLPRVNFVVGFPFENEKDFDLTAAFLDRVAGYLESVGSVNTLFVLPMTRLAHDAKKMRIEPIFQPVALDCNWLHEDADPQKRIDRAYRLIEIARQHNLPVMQTNVEYTRVLLKDKLGRDPSGPFPISVAGGNIVPQSAIRFRLEPDLTSPVMVAKIKPPLEILLVTAGAAASLDDQSLFLLGLPIRKVLYHHGDKDPMLQLEAAGSEAFIFRTEPGDLGKAILSVDADGQEKPGAVDGSYFRSNDPLILQRKGPLQCSILNRLVSIHWQLSMVSSFPHLYFDVDLPDGRRLRSFDGSSAWISLDPNGTAVIRSRIGWAGEDLCVGSRMEMTPGRIRWRLIANVSRPIVLKRFKAGIALGTTYDRAGSPDKTFQMNPKEKDGWVVVGPLDSKGRMPLAEGFCGKSPILSADSSEDIPTVSLRPVTLGSLLPVVQMGCHLGPGLGYYTEEFTVDRGHTVLVEFEIAFELLDKNR